MLWQGIQPVHDHGRSCPCGHGNTPVRARTPEKNERKIRPEGPTSQNRPGGPMFRRSPSAYSHRKSNSRHRTIIQTMYSKSLVSTSVSPRILAKGSTLFGNGGDASTTSRGHAGSLPDFGGRWTRTWMSWRFTHSRRRATATRCGVWELTRTTRNCFARRARVWFYE